MALLAFFSGHATWATSLRDRDFRLLWVATLFHFLGRGMEQVALGWLVLEMTDSPFMVGVAQAARMAPLLFLGILSGALADRVDRRVYLRVLTLCGAVLTFAMAVVLLTDVVRVWHVMVFSAAAGGLWAFIMTVKQAYIYDLAGPGRALNGLSLNALAQQVGSVVGAVAAGALIAAVGVGGQYLAASAAYVASAAVLLAIRPVRQQVQPLREPIMRNLAGYIRLLRTNRTLRALMFMTAAGELFGFTHQTLLPVLARDVLHVGAVGLGVMTAVRQGGGIIGLMLLANLGEFKRKGLLMFVASAFFGLGQMAFSLGANLLLFLCVLAFINACASVTDTLYKTLMLANVPDEQRGRAMGSFALSVGIGPAGHLGTGGMAAALGAPGALLINGAVLGFISAALAAGLPRIRRLE